MYDTFISEDWMKKAVRSGANAATKGRANKSFINVKMFEPVNKKITISSESDSLLSNYVEFLSASSKKNFSADAVIEALIEKLHGDKSFKAWLTTKEDVAKVAEALETTAQNS